METNAPINLQPNQPEPPVSRMGMSEEKLKQRIETVHDTVKQARSALLLCILASGAMLLCLWNTYASWDRDFAFLDWEDYEHVHIFGNDPTKSEKDNPPLPLNEDEIKERMKKNTFTPAQTAEAWGNHVHARPTQLHKHQIHSEDRDFALLDWKDYEHVHTFGNDPTKSEKDNPPLPLNEDEIKGRIKKHTFTPAQTAEAWGNHVHARPTQLHEHQIHSWVDTQVVSVALLGIKISVSDFAIVGSIALGICSLYLLLCVRRENHEIGYLFREMSDSEMTTVGYHAYAMVTSYMVFNITGLHGKRTDGVICSLNKSPQERKLWGIRGASGLLDFLPAITILFTILCDFGWTCWTGRLTDIFGHLFFLSPFRAQFEGSVYSTSFEHAEKVYFWCAESFAFSAMLVLFIMSNLVRQFDKGTRDLLENVHSRLIEEKIIKPRWTNYSKKDPDANSLSLSCSGHRYKSPDK